MSFYGNSYQYLAETFACIIMKNAGIDILPFCSFPSIYMKAWIGNSMECDFDKFMKTSIAGEF